jgi:hypothetical protein
MLNPKYKILTTNALRIGLFVAFVLAAIVALEKSSVNLQAENTGKTNEVASAFDKNSAPPTELLNFDTRCHAAGVLVCEGFDSTTDFVRAKWPNSGLYPAADEMIRGTMDTSVKASGKSSLRFEIPSHSPANSAGSWRQNIGRGFGEGSTFYVQFRQRFSKEMLKNNWGETSWKQVIFHNSGATCADVELTTGQYYRDGFPIMYTDCGGRMISTNAGVPPYKLEQGDYNCWYGEYNAKNCFFYPIDQWVTFYYQISIGHWGKPDSSIQAWAALDGQAYRQWIKMPNYLLKNENPGKDYDTITLLTYMTGKSLLISQPVAYTWYDELIVSTAPIAAPVASAKESATAPAPAQ